jgi:hypothetical protein
VTESEVALLIGPGDVILAADVSGSPGAVPDTRRRWETIWRLRDQLVEIVHSHPLGPDTFSSEDLTTFAALDAALGRRLTYSLVAPGGVWCRGESGQVRRPGPTPWWVALLRAASGMRP